jgi:hypothetical protein
MDVPPSVDQDRRCPSCGALVSADAQWCGQCFTSLTEPLPADEPAPPANRPAAPADERVPASGGVGTSEPAGTGAGAPRTAPTWPCPTCGTDNEIELDACAVCGTPFAALMRQDDRPPEIAPKDALAWSLIFPGLGHLKTGHGADGLARGVLFLLLFAMALLTGLSGSSVGAVLGLFAVFMCLALAVYAGSAYEAYRLASGGEPLVSARTLLWVTVGVILVSIVLLAVTVMTAARR